MISIQLSVREALLVYEKLLSVANVDGIPVRERIAQAIERATVHTSAKEEASLTVYSMDPERFIPCIRELRLITRWGLRESKEFFDKVRGNWFNGTYYDGVFNTLKGFSKSDCEKLACELRALGCDCSVSVR